MIEQAKSEHIPFIQRRLSPFKKIESSIIEHIIHSPNEMVFVNPKEEVVCRIRHNIKNRTNHVAWLLPANEETLDLYLVMARTLVEVSKRFPEHNDFKTWARFKDRRGCLSIFDKNVRAKAITSKWNQMFPQSSHVKWQWYDNSWIIWGNHGEIVEDILNFLDKQHDIKQNLLYL